MAEDYGIACNAAKENSFKVHAKNGIAKFKGTKEGLCCCTFSDEHKELVKEEDKKKKETNFVMTLEENKATRAPQQFEEAKRARTLCHNIGAPRVKTHKALVQANAVKSCPVTAEHVTRAKDTFGKNIAHVKGKTTRSKPKPVTQDEISVPREICDKHRDIAFHMDTMFIDGLGFLTSAGHLTCCCMCKSLDSTSHDNCCKTIDKAFRVCNKVGF